jgi:peptide/nickel transport system permease protein
MTAIIVSVFLTITIANKEDLIISSETRGNLFKGWLAGVGGPTRVKYQSTSREIAEDLYGSAQTPIGRNLRLLYRGITLNLGESQKLYYYSGGELLEDVEGIILDSLPRTLLLFGTANFLLFFVAIFVALVLFKMSGKWLDRLMTSLAPISSVPSWLYGMVLTVFFAQVLHIFVGGVWDSWPAEFKVEHIPIVLKSLMIPILAIFISKFFQSVYAWRNFFRINMNEDFVEMAKAKGLPNRVIARSYILKPTLPGIITSFVLIIILIWQEAIVIELFFSVAGIGHLFYSALAYSDMPLIVGLTVTFAYLLAISILLLDVIYVLVDPRVKVGIEGQTLKAASGKKKGFRLLLSRSRSMNRMREQQISSSEEAAVDFSSRLKELWSRLQYLARSFIRSFRVVLRQPGARIGLIVISILFAISIYTVIAIPYDEAISLWRGEDGVWVRNPKKAPPAWFNVFTRNKLPNTIILNSADGTGGFEGNPDYIHLRLSL